MGPEPSASMDEAMGSLRPRSLAFWEISEPMRPPPMTMVSGVAASWVLIMQDDLLIMEDEGKEGEKASVAVERLAIARMVAATAAADLMVTKVKSEE